jgi:hypothetical protein
MSACMTLFISILLLVTILLTGCEPASTYDPKRGRYVSTEEYRTDQINREIDKREAERDTPRD